MSRLTDEDLEWMRRKCSLDDADTDDLIDMTAYALRAVAEIKERRAADPTDEDREALRWLRGLDVLDRYGGERELPVIAQRACSVLNRLLRGAK